MQTDREDLDSLGLSGIGAEVAPSRAQSAFLLQEGTVSQQNRTTRRGSFHEKSHYSDHMGSCADTAGLAVTLTRLLTYVSLPPSDPSLEVPSAGPVAKTYAERKLLYIRRPREDMTLGPA